MGIVVDKLRVLYICIIGFKCNLNYIFQIFFLLEDFSQVIFDMMKSYQWRKNLECVVQVMFGFSGVYVWDFQFIGNNICGVIIGIKYDVNLVIGKKVFYYNSN